MERYPTDKELSDALGITTERLTEIEIAASRTPKSLESRVGENEDNEIGELLADPKSNMDSEAIFSQGVKEALNALESRERNVLYLYYAYGYTIEEIGQMLGSSRANVSKIKEIALDKLRKLEVG